VDDDKMLDGTTRLNNFVIGGWSRCPDTGDSVPTTFSRVCPLVKEVYELRGEGHQIPPAFGCASSGTKYCGAQSWVVDTALEEEENGTRRRYLGPQYQDFLDSWYALASTAKYINRMVDEVTAAVALWRAKGQRPKTGSWADNQCVLYELLLSEDG
jgi:hypothetical protein